MKIKGFIWLDNVVEKIETKHNVTPEEVPVIWIRRSEKIMEKNNEASAEDALPENFDSFETFWNFWDTHSSADYEEFTEPVEAEIHLSSRKIYCAIAPPWVYDCHKHPPRPPQGGIFVCRPIPRRGCI